jgi:Tfp pilus assembly protein PilO
MSSRNVFILLITAFILLINGFLVFIYNPKQTDREQIQKKLQTTINNFNSAKHAEHDLENIREILILENAKLEKIKDKFISKNQLSEITLKLRDATKQNNLSLIDFTPVFQQYFADTTQSNVKTLPFSVTVRGKYTEIGNFIESWGEFNFYMIPDEIHIQRANSKSNSVEADITGRLYAWSKGYE